MAECETLRLARQDARLAADTQAQNAAREISDLRNCKLETEAQLAKNTAQLAVGLILRPLPCHQLPNKRLGGAAGGPLLCSCPLPG